MQQAASQGSGAPARNRRKAPWALIIFFALTIASSPGASGQTYTVLHDFADGGDGGFPYTGLTIDTAGNFYGTTDIGGTHGHGVIYRLKRGGAGWLLTPIYSFAGGRDGSGPQGRVTIARDGTLYGTTTAGGTRDRGTVFRLQPQAAAPRTALQDWTKTLVHDFNGIDGGLPQGDLMFDTAGNIYGTSLGGGDNNWGTIYKLSPSGGGWTESVLYSASEDHDGIQPLGGVVMDAAGNLYGTFSFSSGGNGMVFKLSPSGSGWTLENLHNFGFDGDNGIQPQSGLIFDHAGNLFGTTFYGGTFLPGGAVYELSPSGGSWSYNTIASLLDGDGGPVDKLMMDSAGNLYGTALNAGAFGYGSIFKLTPSAGGWTYTSLHDFCAGGFPCADGEEPRSNVVMDAAGNLYGTASTGGANNQGVIWQIAP